MASPDLGVGPSVATTQPPPAQQPTRSEPSRGSSGGGPKRSGAWRKWLLVPLVLAAGVAGYFGWKSLQPAKLPDGFASSNGRIEATEVDIAAKLPGRLRELLVDEGDFVTAGQVLARMDTDVLTAQ